jgi:hypothetical protein
MNAITKYVPRTTPPQCCLKSPGYTDVEIFPKQDALDKCLGCRVNLPHYQGELEIAAKGLPMGLAGDVVIGGKPGRRIWKHLRNPHFTRVDDRKPFASSRPGKATDRSLAGAPTPVGRRLRSERCG